MLTSSLSYIIARSFPECILLILASYILLNIKIDIKEITKKSIAFLIVVMAIRFLPISFGIHTILIMFVLGVILYKMKNQNIIDTILALSKIFICLAISEAIYVGIAVNTLNISTEILTNNTSLESALASLPSLLIFIILVLVVKKLEDKIRKV